MNRPKHWPTDLSEGDERKLERVRDEIHARILWGEASEDIRGWVLRQDSEASPELVDEIIRDSLRERDESLRKQGYRDLGIGAALFLPGMALTIYGGYAIYDGSGGRIAFALLVVGVLAAAAGAYFLNRGFDGAVFGGSQRGGVRE